MPTITLPDGSTKDFEGPVTGLQVAESIGQRLADAAVGCLIDGELADLSRSITHDASLSLLTKPGKGKEADKHALTLLRHSTAHVMAEAIQRVVPGAQLVYGPPLDSGFYYDIAFPEDRPLREGDFEAIEKEMAEIVKENRPFTRYELPKEWALRKLEGEGNKYKLDNGYKALAAGSKSLSFYVTGHPAISALLPSDTEIVRMKVGVDKDGNGIYANCLKSEKAGVGSRYWIDSHTQIDSEDLAIAYEFAESASVHSGNWEDLCRGPHLPSTGKIGAFKIMSLASSYWHGDENSDRLTRVYGTAFFSKKDLDEYLDRLEQAKARDHRVIGKKLGLFHIDEAVGQGLVLWTPKGSVIRKELQDWIGVELRKQGYTDVFCPHIGKLDLYKTSGHFPYYAESQFTPVIERAHLKELADESCSCADLMAKLEDGDIEGYLLKPMNCPHHIKIYDAEPRSYRDLPIRLSEFGTVYRWEQSGELSGMTRVRSFTVDDAHLFCREDQIGDEVAGCLSLVKLAFETLGLHDFRVRVGLRDPDSTKYVGDPEVWDKAEAACRQAAAQLGSKVTEEPGEAAFYGPKIDFVVRDVLGREWQLGTVQVDYNLPERFDLSYIGADNKPHRPVMIHRAPFGSMERFVGVLIEHFGGAFPTWLSPEQVRVLPISEKSNDYAAGVRTKLVEAGVRCGLDDGDGRVQAKIKNAAEERIPYLLVVGPRDAEGGTVSVRARGVEKDLGAMPAAEFADAIAQEIATKGATKVTERFAPAATARPG